MKFGPIFGLLVLAQQWAPAAVQLNGVFGDHMVLQRDAKVPVWGLADPGEKIAVTFQSQTKETVANAAGAWTLQLDPMPANANPAALVVKGSNEIKIDDILVGEVWLCSGQSNMAMTMAGVRKSPIYGEDLNSANFPLIRQGLVPTTASIKPLPTTPVNWSVCTPTTVQIYGATAFYFARHLYLEMKVPVGIILSAVGATGVDYWTSKESLDGVPEFKEMAEREIAFAEQFPSRIAAYPDALAAWEKANNRTDSSNEGEKAGWMNPQSEQSPWRPVKAGMKLSELGLPAGGVAWVREEIQVPAVSAGKNLRLEFGPNLDQYLTVYWNGKKVGQFGHTPPAYMMGPVVFNIPSSEVTVGANLLAVRFVAHVGNRSLMLPKISGADDGLCSVRIESTFLPLAGDAAGTRPALPKNSRVTTLFGGMIHPLIPFAMRGVVWYQGESNVSGAEGYQKLLPLLIRDWRSRWAQGDFPFLIQQLPNYDDKGRAVTKWAELREAQWNVSQTVPNALLSVGIDIGASHDLHPANKRDIGDRLALVALNKVYGQKVLCSGPALDSAGRDASGKWHLKFLTAGVLKTRDGAAPRQFTLAGADHKFMPADALVQGNEVVLSCDLISQPEAVRYAWTNDPDGLNLTDDSNLPTIPFRTDHWASKPIPTL